MSTDVQQQAVAFLIAVSRIINSMRMYSPDHPVVKQGGEEAGRMLGELLVQTDSVAIGSKDGKLLVFGKRLPEDTPAAGRFLDMLEARNMRSVSFERGVTDDELVYFLQLVSKRKDDVVDGDRIRPELLVPLTHVKVNELRYAEVGQDGLPEGGGGSGGSGVGSGGAGAMLAKLFADELAAPANLSSQQLATIFDRMAPMLGGGAGEGEGGGEDGGAGAGGGTGPQSAARGYFEQAFGQLASEGGFAGMQEALLGTVLTMQPDAQRALFGRVITDGEQAGELLKSFSLERRAAMVVESAGDDPEAIAAALKALVSEDGELVELAEAICARLPGDESTRRARLAQLTGALVGSAPAAAGQRGRVIIADADDEACAAYEALLGSLDVTSERLTDGDQLLAALAQDPPTALILDIKLTGKTGLEVLAALDQRGGQIPVILCTDHKGAAEAFEVKMYPRMHVAPKPVDAARLLHLLRPYLRPAAFDEGSASAEQLDRARAIQRRLVPQPDDLVELPGFELAVRYLPCGDIGGDLLDIIPLDERHLGVVIADVSGRGVDTAMVMVMLRSVVRSLAPTVRSPRELLLRANQTISRDTVRGMFVTAAYGVLDLHECELTIAFAGHFPAVTFDATMGLALMTELGGTCLGLIQGELFEQSIFEQSVKLGKGDTVLLYTGGVIEARNTKGVTFGEERLRKLVNMRAERGASGVLDSLGRVLTRHTEGVRQTEDITAFALTCLQARDEAPETRRIQPSSLPRPAPDPTTDRAPDPTTDPTPDAPPDATPEPPDATSTDPELALLEEPEVDEDALKQDCIRRLMRTGEDAIAQALMALDVDTLAGLARAAMQRPAATDEYTER